MCLPFSSHFKGVTLTDLKEAEKTMGRAGDSRAAPEQRNKEDEKHDKDGEQQSQETTVEMAGGTGALVGWKAWKPSQWRNFWLAQREPR